MAGMEIERVGEYKDLGVAFADFEIEKARGEATTQDKGGED